MDNFLFCILIASLLGLGLTGAIWLYVILGDSNSSSSSNSGSNYSGGSGYGSSGGGGSSSFSDSSGD